MTTTTVSHTQIRSFLTETSPFDRLSEAALKSILPKCQLLGYRTGQPLFERDKMPTQVSIIYQGQARLLGYDFRTQRHLSLRLLGAGEVVGWAGLVRGIPCETAIASTDMICITLPAADFLQLIGREPSFGEAFRDHASVSEVFELLSQEVQQRANLAGNFKEFCLDVWPDAIVVNLLNGQKRVPDLAAMLDPERVWLISSGSVGDFDTG
ncbi:MAG: cyclic nucleotide-binding domain-containing protein, partial [Cyanobacteriota bacterium]|nr:cyclic nucleotide-binding domain-containing protein [Cyanobacteriota bacterium]